MYAFSDHHSHCCCFYFLNDHGYNGKERESLFQQIYGWIQNITVYLIVTAAVMHAIPGKDYGKYIRFFSGLILILLLATPILNLTDMKERFDTLYGNSEYEMEKQEIESVDEFYKNAGLSGYLQTDESYETGVIIQEDAQINVGEIEIGRE